VEGRAVSLGGCGGGGGVVETSIAGIAAALWFSRLGRLSIALIGAVLCADVHNTTQYASHPPRGSREIMLKAAIHVLSPAPFFLH
jgi:hypothetical protein